jgi:nitroimidazol reductase NimA-like FMN-containing flavoprotein (pyridoxamine 5'-phosphate oxidase superfamily)
VGQRLTRDLRGIFSFALGLCVKGCSLEFHAKAQGKSEDAKKSARSYACLLQSSKLFSLPMRFTEDSMDKIPQTPRTTLKRLPQRGSYDREIINQILDEGFICHVGFSVDGRPFVIPTGYARVGDSLFIHGSQASRMLRTLEQGIDVCVTVTLLDGLVLARSAFNHSMNYRSVVVLGNARVVDDPEEKLEALRALSEHMIPGRWDDVRQPSERELQLTTVLSVPLNEASAKVRTGPPLDDEEDYDLPVWAGLIPLRLVAGTPIDDPRSPENSGPPKYAVEYIRPGRKW